MQALRRKKYYEEKERFHMVYTCSISYQYFTASQLGPRWRNLAEQLYVLKIETDPPLLS